MSDRQAPTCPQCGSVLSCVTWECVTGPYCRGEVLCPHCGGEGGWEGEFSPLYYGKWTECTYCGGTGNAPRRALSAASPSEKGGAK